MAKYSRINIDGRFVTMIPMLANGEMKHGRWGKQVTKLVKYAMFEWTEGSPTGEPRGMIYLDRCTFEQKTPGRRWVNKRWESPRWYYTPTDPTGKNYRRGSPHETRKMAMQACLQESDFIQKILAEIARTA